MAKCNALTGSAVKGLTALPVVWAYVSIQDLLYLLYAAVAFVACHRIVAVQGIGRYTSLQNFTTVLEIMDKWISFLFLVQVAQRLSCVYVSYAQPERDSSCISHTVTDVRPFFLLKLSTVLNCFTDECENVFCSVFVKWRLRQYWLHNDWCRSFWYISTWSVNCKCEIKWNLSQYWNFAIVCDNQNCAVMGRVG